MILFALTSDIKQSTDYADLEVCFMAFPTVTRSAWSSCIRLRTHLFTVLPFRF